MLPMGIPFNPKAPEEPRTGASARSAQPSPEVPEHSPTPPSMVLNYDFTGAATSTVGSFQIGGAVNSPVATGAAASGSPPGKVSNAITVTIGGPATVLF